MSDERRTKLGSIRRAATIVELRLRVARGLTVLPATLTAALAVAAVTLAVRKVLPASLDNRRAWEILIAAGAFVALSVIVAMLRRLPPSAGAVALDKHHALHGRLTNALAFDHAPERSALMDVAIDDACDHADKLSPRRAAPIPIPRDLLGSVAVAAGVAAIALLHVPVPVPQPAPQQKLIDAVQLSPDDVELFRTAAQELGKKDQSPEVKAALEKFNQLIEDIAQKRIDRAEAFRKMEQIERELVTGTEADAKAFSEALKRTAEDLKTSELAKPLAESLDKQNLDQAKKDLKNLAAQLRESRSDAKGKKKIDKSALDRLRQALDRASKQRKEALAAVQEKRNEAHEQQEQLLKKKEQNRDPDAGPPNPEDERLLKKKERELERLDRDVEKAARDQRRLDRLDRDLAKAAQDLMKDLGLSAEDLEQAAEDINRMQDEQMSEKEKEELRQRLEELREQLRQQGQGGKERMKRMMKFGKRARGGSGQKGSGQNGKGGQPGKDGDDGDQGDDGDEKDGQGKQGEGKDGEGKDGDGEGKDGQGGHGGKGRGLTLKLTMGGSGAGDIPLPGGGAGQGESGGQGQGQDSPGGGPGKGIGTSHDPNVMGKRTDMKSGTADVQEQGLDTKQGPSNSEVILGAADRGFRGSGYKKVFTDYHTRAEDQINKDQVPDGYRFYVHRYFQLIRPRE